MATATFKTGHPTFAEHSVASDGTALAAGSVVLNGNYPGITHSHCEPGQKVGLAMGGGLYLVSKATGAGSGPAKGAAVYYHSSNLNFSALSNATAYKHAGYAAAAAGDSDTTMLIYHNPNGTQGS